MSGWTKELPHNDGLYWRYISKGHGGDRNADVVEISDGIVYGWGEYDHFVSSYKGTDVWWHPAELIHPTLPDELQAQGNKSPVTPSDIIDAARRRAEANTPWMEK